MNRIDLNLGVAKADRFEDVYYQINRQMLERSPSVASRNGNTKEELNFKTIVDSPTHRCVGGYRRDVNIFFLLAEAIWIWCGRMDVAFLNIFNSRMADYSDDGVYFHAPYGWRMRNYGVDSMNGFTEENKHAAQGMDQISTVLQMLHLNPEDRRAVISIWNPELDLAVQSKDIPCNDVIMFKVRNGALYTTVQNRSNDLHWGLLTNVFQFSFVSEMMAKILNVRQGTQVHNSQSLHMYTALPLTTDLVLEMERAERAQAEMNTLYQFGHVYNPAFNFNNDEDVIERLKEVDFHLHSIILGVLKVWNGNFDEEKDGEYFKTQLKEFSPQLYLYWKLLAAYTMYKRSKLKKQLLTDILEVAEEFKGAPIDVLILAINFVYSRSTERRDLSWISRPLNHFWADKKLF